MNKFFDMVFWGNPIRDWAISLGIIVGCILIARLVQPVVIGRIRQAAAKTKTTLDDFAVVLLQKSIMPFLYILAVYYGLKYLEMSPRVEQYLKAAVFIISVFFIVRMIKNVVGFFFRRLIESRDGGEAQLKQASGILRLFEIVLWILAAIFIVDNLGYNITTIITGLGIGGIAIALAAQAILGDLFSYLVIFFDKPFEIGDFIIVGQQMGVVEYIGIKTTRVRAIGGEQLIVSNTDLTSSRVQNFKRMQKRRVVFSTGVVYETSSEQLKKIPQIVKSIIESLPNTQFDRAHFASFGDFSLNFEIVYYILSADYNQYMDTQQAINLALFEEFEKNGIGFAYPTQKIYFDPPAISSTPASKNPSTL